MQAKKLHDDEEQKNYDREIVSEEILPYMPLPYCASWGEGL